MINRKKFFGVSMPRTGTSSLAYAIRVLGLNTSHYLPKWDYAQINIYEFANDFPITFKYKELDERFPGSGFIYSDRPVDDWLKSYELHWERTGHLTVGNWDEYNMEVFGTLKFDKEIFREAFLNHRAEVFEYFKDRPDDLLVLEMPYQHHAWSHLSTFIGIKPPKVLTFPHKCGSFSTSNAHCPLSKQNPDPSWR